MTPDARATAGARSPEAWIDLLWLPLGAGGRSVRWNGRVYEALVSRVERRAACDLYHAALELAAPGGRFVIEQAPAWNGAGERGVVATGPVGARWAGRSRLFRYEVRCWRDGHVPDRGEAVESPIRVSADPATATRLLGLVPHAPTPTWGRDELGAGEMWNSNSLVAWLLARAGTEVEAVRLPRGGRAPGWHAGIAVARRLPAR